MTKIVPLAAELEFASTTNRQVNADSQRDAWLRQLEQGQMALFQEEGQLRQAPGDTHRSNALSQAKANTSREANTPHDAAPSLARPSVLPVQPMAPAAAAELGAPVCTTEAQLAATAPAITRPPAPEAASSAPSAALDPQRTSTQGAGYGSLDAGSHKALAAMLAGVNAHTLSSRLDMAAMQPARAVLLAPSVPALVASVTALGEITNNTAPPVPTQRSELAAAPASATLKSATATPPEDASDATDDGLDALHHRANESEPSPPNVDWQKRQMHIAQMGRDVSVSIRDGSLDSHQASQLVYKLLSDVAATRLRLSRATVNGRLVFRSAHLPSAGNTLPVAMTGTLDYGPSRSTLIQEQPHGA